MKNKTWGAVIVAAGSGTRFGQGIPKQFRRLHGVSLVEWSIRVFSSIDEIEDIVVVVPADSSLWKPFWKPHSGIRIVTGGLRRQDSVVAGLEALHSAEMVLIHDAARPLVSASLIGRVMKGVISSGAAIPVIPVRDTVKRVTSASTVAGTVSRENLRMSQTPQGFILEDILEVLKSTDEVTDECTAMELAGYEVLAVAGDPENVKLTDPEDIEIIKSLAGKTMERRTGTGLDFHPFELGIPCVVGGCRMESDFGLKGHSDGDAVLHSIADALLSAARLGDIGVLFPPGDDRWKDADSAVLLKKTCDLVRGDGWEVEQIDVTVISDFPKIAPVRNTMIERIAGIVDTEPDKIWVKGTSTNTLGDIGEGKGLGCLVMAKITRSHETPFPEDH